MKIYISGENNLNIKELDNDNLFFAKENDFKNCISQIINFDAIYFTGNINTKKMQTEKNIAELLNIKFLNKKPNIKFLNKKQNIEIIFLIKKIVSEYFGMSIIKICKKTRKKKIVHARQIAHFFAKQLTEFSLANIGLNIGNKDHATVLHGIKTIQYESDKYRNVTEEIKSINNLINDEMKKINLNYF